MPDPKGASVIADAAAAAAASDADAGGVSLKDLSDRFSKMETALEQAELSAKYHTELAAYVGDLRREAANIQLARRIVGGAALIAAVLLAAAPVWIVANEYPWFLTLPNYVAASVIIGSFAASVLLVSTLARSVFRSAHERQTDEFIPPQLKLIHELMQGQRG